MVKADPVVVGHIHCPTPNCDQTAEVRERSTGKKLKYLYCPECKSNQQSGKAFQDYILKNMFQPGDEPLKTDELTEISTELTEKKTEAEPDFWRPGTKPDPKADGDPDQNETVTTKKLNGMQMVGVLVLILVVFGGGYLLFKIMTKPKAEKVAA